MHASQGVKQAAVLKQGTLSFGKARECSQSIDLTGDVPSDKAASSSWALLTPMPSGELDVKATTPANPSLQSLQGETANAHSTQEYDGGSGKRRRTGSVIFREYPKGVLDNAILSRVDAIVQQANCVGCDGRGLAEAIAKALPYGCSYRGRRRMPPQNKFAVESDRATPGSIDVRRPQSQADAKARMAQPIVINLFTQWEMGAALKYNRVKPAPVDSTENREAWFRQALRKVGAIEPRLTSIAFPHQIGCGLAGGNWDRYRQMIEQFALENPDIDVMICKLSGGAASMKPPANRQAGTRGGSCFKCGKPGHWASSCPA